MADGRDVGPEMLLDKVGLHPDKLNDLKMPEQRIVDCLISLCDFIAARAQKHEALKTHKECLMQQLFPSQEEAAA